MTTAYTSLLGLALPVTGELSGTWGDTVNNSITSLLDTSVAGTTNVSTDTDVTLTTTTGAANTARQAILLFSGARTALRTVTAPAQSKIYTVINATTGGFSVKLVGSGPTTGLTIPNGASATVAWNGSDFVEVGAGSIGNLVVNGTLTVTGATTLSGALTYGGVTLSNAVTGTGSMVLSSSPTLVTPALGTPSALVGTNITGTATSFNINGTVGATTPASGAFTTLSASSTVTLSGGTANGVAYLNGSKVVTSGSALTFDGTTLGVSNGSAGSAGISITGTYSGSGTVAFLNFQRAGGAVAGTLGYNDASTAIQFGTTTNHSTIFLQNNAEAMRLTSTGLGIGTSSIGERLVVSGSASVDVYKLRSNTSAPASTDAFIYRPADNTIALGTANTERMRLDSSGNLGLGVTPSAWRSVDRVMQAGSGVSQFGHFVSGGVGAVYGGGFYRDDSGFKYTLTATPAGRFDFNYTTSGGFTWNIAPTGTAGNAITFTQAMTLDASGNLLVGTTASQQKFMLGGNQRFYNTASDGVTNSVIGQIDAQFRNYGAGIATSNLSAIQFCTDPTYYYRGDIRFLTNGSDGTSNASTERARIDSSGKFLIGTTAGGGELSFKDVTGVKIQFNADAANSYTISKLAGGGNLGDGEFKFTSGNTSAGAFTFSSGGTERARIDSSGNLLVGTTSGSARTVIKGNSAGALSLVFNSTSAVMVEVNGSNSINGVDGTPNANGLMRVWRDSGNLRSISAAGTINASGADYAEYITKSGNFTVAKGDVVGINAQGKLTNVFADAVTFVVKSTDPSYVGNDSWGAELEGDALEAVRQTVDRIAFAGQVPVNVTGATAGQFIIPVNDNGAIKGVAKNEADLTMSDYIKSVGKVIAIEADGRARIIVKVA